VIQFHESGSIKIKGEPLFASLNNQLVQGFERPAYDQLVMKYLEQEFTFQISAHKRELNRFTIFLNPSETNRGIFLYQRTPLSNPK